MCVYVSMLTHHAERDQINTRSILHCIRCRDLVRGKSCLWAHISQFIESILFFFIYFFLSDFSKIDPTHFPKQQFLFSSFISSPLNSLSYPMSNDLWAVHLVCCNCCNWSTVSNSFRFDGISNACVCGIERFYARCLMMHSIQVENESIDSERRNFQRKKSIAECFRVMQQAGQPQANDLYLSTYHWFKLTVCVSANIKCILSIAIPAKIDTVYIVKVDLPAKKHTKNECYLFEKRKHIDN